MRKVLLASCFGLATLATGAEARAWGLHAGDTIGVRDNLPYVEAGWPGVTIGFAHGFTERFEVGGRLDTIYGYEGETRARFGMGVAGTVRFTLVRAPAWRLEVHVFPGIRFDGFSPTNFGVQFPVGLEAGYRVTPVATVSLGADLGLFADATRGSYFATQPEAGPGLELHLNEHVALGAVTRFGGVVLASAGGGPSAFAFRAQGYFGYRM